MAWCKVNSKCTSNILTAWVLTDIILRWDEPEIKMLWDFIVQTSNDIEKLKVDFMAAAKKDISKRNEILAKINRNSDLIATSTLAYSTNSPIYKNLFLRALKDKYSLWTFWTLWTSADVIKFVDELWWQNAKLTLTLDNITEQSVDANMYKQAFMSWLWEKYTDKNWMKITTDVSNTLKNKTVMDYYYVQKYWMDRFIADVWTKKYADTIKKMKMTLKKEWIDFNEYQAWWATINKLFNDELKKTVTKDMSIEEAAAKLNSLVHTMFWVDVVDDYLSYLISRLDYSKSIKEITDGDTIMKYVLQKQVNSWLVDIDSVIKIAEDFWYSTEWIWYQYLTKSIDDIINEDYDAIIQDFRTNIDTFNTLWDAEKKNIVRNLMDYIQEKRIDESLWLSNIDSSKKQIRAATKIYDNLIKSSVKVDIKDIPNMIKYELFRNKAKSYALDYVSWDEKKTIDALMWLIDAIQEWKAVKYLSDKENILNYLWTEANEKLIKQAYSQKMFEIVDMIGMYSDNIDMILDNENFLNQLDTLLPEWAQKDYYVDRMMKWKSKMVQDVLWWNKIKWKTTAELLNMIWDRRNEYVNWLSKILKESVDYPKPADINYVLTNIWQKKIVWDEWAKYVYLSYAKDYLWEEWQQLKNITQKSFEANRIDFDLWFTFDAAITQWDINAKLFDFARKQENIGKKIIVVLENWWDGEYLSKWVRWMMSFDDLSKPLDRINIEVSEPRYGLSFKLTDANSLQVQAIDSNSYQWAIKSLWNIDWITYKIENDPALQKTLNESIAEYLSVMWVNDMESFVEWANAILWWKPITYNFKELMKRMDFISSITNWTYAKQFVDIKEITQKINKHISSLDNDWFIDLANSIADDIGINIDTATLNIKNRKTIKDMLLKSVVWDNSFLAKAKLLQEMWIDVDIVDMVVRKTKTDVVLWTINKLNVEWWISFAYDIWDVKATLWWMYDNKNIMEKTVSELFQWNTAVYEQLPDEVKIFTQRNFIKNQDKYENKQIFWFKWTISEYDETKKAASVLWVLNKSMDETIDSRVIWDVLVPDETIKTWINTIDNRLYSFLWWEQFVWKQDLSLEKIRINNEYMQNMENIIMWEKMEIPTLWRMKSMNIFVNKTNDIRKMLWEYDTKVNELLWKKLSTSDMYQSQKKLQNEYKQKLYNYVQSYLSEYWTMYDTKNIKDIVLIWNQLLFAPTKAVAKDLASNIDILTKQYEELFTDMWERIVSWEADIHNWTAEAVAYVRDIVQNWWHNAIIWWKPYNIWVDEALSLELQKYDWWSIVLDKAKQAMTNNWLDAFDESAKKYMYLQFFYANNAKRFSSWFMGTVNQVLSDNLWLRKFFEDSKLMVTDIGNSRFIKDQYQWFDIVLPSVFMDNISASILADVVGKVAKESELWKFWMNDAITLDKIIKRNVFKRLSAIFRQWKPKDMVWFIQKSIADVFDNAVIDIKVPTGSLEQYTNLLWDNLTEYVKAQEIWLFSDVKNIQYENFVKSEIDSLNAQSWIITEITNWLWKDTTDLLAKTDVMTDTGKVNLWQFADRFSNEQVAITNDNIWKQIAENMNLLDKNTNVSWKLTDTMKVNSWVFWEVDEAKILATNEEQLFDYCDLLLT